MLSVSQSHFLIPNQGGRGPEHDKAFFDHAYCGVHRDSHDRISTKKTSSISSQPTVQPCWHSQISVRHCLQSQRAYPKAVSEFVRVATGFVERESSRLQLASGPRRRRCWEWKNRGRWRFSVVSEDLAL